MTLEHVDRHDVASLDLECFAESLREDHTAWRQANLLAIAVHDAFETLSRRNTGDGEIPFAIAGAHADGHGSLWLDGDHTRQAFERVPRGAAARLDEVDGHVLSLGFPELDLDQASDHIVEDEPEHEDRHRERNAEHRGSGAKRVTRD